MAISVGYTPYGAVGKLAAAGGRAQQAVRDQQIAEQKAAQERSINASMELQTQQLDSRAALQETELVWNTANQNNVLANQRRTLQVQLDQQAQQARYNREVQEQQFEAQQKARERELATQKRQFDERNRIQEDQIETQNLAREKAFTLQTAAEERMLQSTRADIDRSSALNMIGLGKLQLEKDRLIGDTNLWNSMYTAGGMSESEYNLGKIRMSQGKAPAMPGTRTMTAYQLENLRQRGMGQKEAYLAMERKGFSGVERKQLKEDVKAFAGIGGIKSLGYTGWLPDWDRTEEQLEDRYKDFIDGIDYTNLTQRKRTQADAEWDSWMKKKDEDNWAAVRSSKTVKDLRAQPSLTEQMQSRAREAAPGTRATNRPEDQPAASQQELANVMKLAWEQRGL